jgi:sigma-B regulation protein RsbU (phosphoserine phosphatase)
VPDPLAEAQREAQLAADELIERYEEINLLYGIGESLGRTVSLPEAATIILGDIAETVGARRGVILVHDGATERLERVAVRGIATSDITSIDIRDVDSLLARAFRERHVVLASRDDVRAPHEAPLSGALLAVPILWTSAEGAVALGVLALADHVSAQSFTAGDQKLLAAIATQIGAAIENARLVQSSLAQQRLVHEMQLAHHLQMKLLPAGSVVAPEAEAAARVVPADSVGGDFYHLFKLDGASTGVMIGDVSGHGYQAALIMALAMSAAAIHAQRTTDPARVLHDLMASLRDELVSTDMFFTVCYAVVDPARGELRYANLGHPHVFVVRADGRHERLTAQAPPLGLGGDAPIAVTTLPWARGADVLVGFTDGVSDSRNADGVAFGESRVLATVVAQRAAPAAQIVDTVFQAVAHHADGVAHTDDLTLVVVRS